MRIDGNGFIVAGGGSGLGLAAAERLSKLGARVAVIDMRQGAWEGPYAQADVAAEDSVEAAFAAVLPQVGDLRGLLNTTGRQPAVTGGTSHVGLTAGPGRSVTAAAFRRALEVNTAGSFILTQAAAERMIASEPDENGERGVIINTSSIVATDGQIGTAAYAASKGGIDAMTLPLAREFARYGIRVMAIAPGIFATPMFLNARGPMVDWLNRQVQFPPRPGRPEEFAQAVADVIANPMFNGTTLRLDGAMRVAAGESRWWSE